LIALRGATAVLLVATAVVDSKDLGDDIFDLRPTGLREISFGKLEHNLRLVIRRRIDVIIGITGDDAQGNYILVGVNLNFCGVDLFSDLNQAARRLFPALLFWAVAFAE